MAIFIRNTRKKGLFYDILDSAFRVILYLPWSHMTTLFGSRNPPGKNNNTIRENRPQRDLIQQSISTEIVHTPFCNVLWCNCWVKKDENSWIRQNENSWNNITITSLGKYWSAYTRKIQSCYNLLPSYLCNIICISNLRIQKIQKLGKHCHIRETIVPPL